MTPSSVRNVWTIIFLMKSTPSQVLGDGRKAVAAFFSTGHSLDTLVAQLVGPLKPRSFSEIRETINDMSLLSTQTTFFVLSVCAFFRTP